MEDVPRGVHVNFLKAERSLHRWALEDLQRIHAAEDLAADEGGGVEMHVLEDAGHWVCGSHLLQFLQLSSEPPSIHFTGVLMLAFLLTKKGKDLSQSAVLKQTVHHKTQIEWLDGPSQLD